MNKQEKLDAVSELKDLLEQVASVVVADFRGLTVEEANALRAEIGKAECQYRVIKNTMILRAIEGTSMEGLTDLFRGPSAIAYSFNDAVAPAKVIDKFASSSKHLKVKGGYMDGQILDTANVKNLASMKGKDELRAELLATFMAPAQGFVRLMAAAPQNMLYLLSARERALGGE